jgi:cytoskeletal protein CcmA (bactofilin family)
MEHSIKPDLIINGISDAAGGQYRFVKIDGIGKIEGNVSSDNFTINGTTRVRGDLCTEHLDCDGKLKVEGNMSAGQSKIDGLIDVIGSLRGEHFAFNGVLNVKGDCEVESFNGEGAFNIKGLLNAGKMNIKVLGRGEAREIGAESIIVRQGANNSWNKLWRWMLPRFSPELHAVAIEGDEIDLEHTTADVVRGNQIVIGKGCTIGRVEYRVGLKVHPGAKVSEEVKTGG